MLIIKKAIAKIYRNLKIAECYYYDYKQYKKYRYDVEKISFEKSQGKIFRQTHIIEKGMSLSHPRKGFGKEKINQLLEYLDEYVEAGYSLGSTVFLNAFYVLKKYIEFQKKFGIENLELEMKLQKYQVDKNSKFDCGICHETKEHLKEMCETGFLGVLESRHSIRQFSEQPLDYSLVKKAVKLAMHSPSECNRQSVKVYIYKDQTIKKQLDHFINGNTGFADEVQNYLIICSDVSSYTGGYERNQMYVDGSLFAMTLMLCLHYLGIGSCALQHSETIQKNQEIRKIINLPQNERVIMFLAIGNYKDEFHYAVSKRKKMEEVYFEF